MEVERRWGLRKPVTADVLIDHQPSGLTHGRIANVSVGGLYVHTAAAKTAPHGPVELVLLQQAQPGTRVYRLPAKVVRSAAEGIGLVLDRYDVDTFRTLVALLLESNSPAQRPAC